MTTSRSNRSYLSIVLAGALVFSAPAMAFAAESSPAAVSSTQRAQGSSGAKTTNTAASGQRVNFSESEKRDYESRQADAAELEQYEGGAVLVITGGALLVAALFVLIFT